MSIVASISIDDTAKLLTSWGFEYAGGNGGHAVYRHKLNGRRVQIPGAGRKAPVIEPMLRKAANICGVPLNTFKQGPRNGGKRPGSAKPSTPPVEKLPPIYKDGAAPVAELETTPDAGGTLAEAIHETLSQAVDALIESKDGAAAADGQGVTSHKRRGAPPGPRPEGWRRPSVRIMEYLQARPGIDVSIGRLSADLDINAPNVSVTLNGMLKKYPEIQRVRRGVFLYTPVRTEPTPEELHEQRVKEREIAQVEAIRQSAREAEECQAAETAGQAERARLARADALARMEALEDLRATPAHAAPKAEASELFQKMYTDPHGRVMLTDEAGEMWLAIRVEPSYFPITPTGGH